MRTNILSPTKIITPLLIQITQQIPPSRLTTLISPRALSDYKNLINIIIQCPTYGDEIGCTYINKFQTSSSCFPRERRPLLITRGSGANLLISSRLVRRPASPTAYLLRSRSRTVNALLHPRLFCLSMHAEDTTN